MQKSKGQFWRVFLYEWKLGHNASEAARNIWREIGMSTVSTSTVLYFSQ